MASFLNDDSSVQKPRTLSVDLFSLPVSDDSSSEDLSDDGCCEESLQVMTTTTHSKDASPLKHASKDASPLKHAHRSFRDHAPINLVAAGATSSAEGETKKNSKNSPVDTPCSLSALHLYLIDRLTERVATLSKPIGFYDSGFEEEYTSLTTRELMDDKPIFVTQTIETKRRNRYANILPLECSVVRLTSVPTTTATTSTTTSTPSATTTTYINANYISGEVAAESIYSSNGNDGQQYIACQAPKKQYLEEFWQMVWQENIPVIAMMTKCKEGTKVKATPYWSELSSATSSIQVQVEELPSNDLNIVRRR